MKSILKIIDALCVTVVTTILFLLYIFISALPIVGAVLIVYGLLS